MVKTLKVYFFSVIFFKQVKIIEDLFKEDLFNHLRNSSSNFNLKIKQPKFQSNS